MGDARDDGDAGPGNLLWRALAVFPLAAILACVLVEAIVLPLGIDDLDEGYFVQQAARVGHGQVPYRDFETLYTPGLVYVHAWLFSIFGGPNLLGPRILALGARAALALLLYVLARPLVRRPVWAAVPGLFLLIALDDAPQRWEPHPGWPSTLCAVLVAWSLTRPATRPWLLAAGAFAAAAYVFKQNTGVFMLIALVAYTRRHAALPVAAFLGGTALWFAPLVIALRGDITNLGGFVGAVNQAGLFSGPEPTIIVPLAALIAGAWLARTPANQKLRWYLLAGIALFGTQYPRMDTLHLAWSAPILLVVGTIVLDRLKPLIATASVAGALALSAPLITSRVEFLQLPKAPIADVLAPTQTATEISDLVADIQQRTRPGEPIFVYPTSPLVYVLADRPNPTRFDHLNPGAATPGQIQEVINDLEASNVRVVVISDFWLHNWGLPGPNAPLDAWLTARFTDVARHGTYRVMVAGL